MKTLEQLEQDLRNAKEKVEEFNKKLLTARQEEIDARTAFQFAKVQTILAKHHANPYVFKKGMLVEVEVLEPVPVRVSCATDFIYTKVKVKRLDINRICTIGAYELLDKNHKPLVSIS